MKGIFWNCDGFRDPKKHRFVSDLTREHNLQFIALSETGRRDFYGNFLKNLCAGKDFIWHHKGPRGRSGGMLLGIDLTFFDIGAIEEGDFYIKFRLCNKNDSFKWALVVVYGPAQNEYKESFLSELVRICSNENLPIMIGGDFNILRSQSEKNNDNYNDRFPFIFNAVIDALNLRELEMTGRQFTWANNLHVPTYEKLDRILVSTEWEQKFPRSTVKALNRDISDHTPLLLNTGEALSTYVQPVFKFELGWLLRDGFYEMVSDLWSEPTGESTPMDNWQEKIRRVRQHLRGWAKSTSGANRKEKKRILDKLDELDKKAESTILSQEEVNLKQCLQNSIANLLREEEVKWYQRAKVKNLLEGDSNTKYFHLIANGKHRKTRIFQLQNGGQIIEGDEALKLHITSYYKELFGPPDTTSINIDESMIDDIPKVSQLENELLVSEFLEKELRKPSSKWSITRRLGQTASQSNFTRCSGR